MSEANGQSSGAYPTFWAAARDFQKQQDQKSLRNIPGEVLAVSGTPPNQLARVRLPGEDATVDRPMFPVYGSAVVGQRVDVFIDPQGPQMIFGTPGVGGGGGAVNPATVDHNLLMNMLAVNPSSTNANRDKHVSNDDLNALMYRGTGIWRVYVAPSFSTQTVNVTGSGWQATTLVPVVTVPALGTPPAGMAWALDIEGGIRIAPPIATTIYLSANFDAVPSTGVDGMGYVPTAQGGVTVAKYGVAPPATNRAFTVNFYFWTQALGNYEFRNGPWPSVHAYTVAV